MFAYSFNNVKEVVKAEISFQVKDQYEKRKVVSDFLPVSKRVDMYRFSELNIQKENAILNRKEWKDLYDLYWMKELYPNEFNIKNRKALVEVMEDLQVPKTANAYIPSTKRPNWEELKEKMKRYLE